MNNNISDNIKSIYSKNKGIVFSLTLPKDLKKIIDDMYNNTDEFVIWVDVRHTDSCYLEKCDNSQNKLVVLTNIIMITNNCDIFMVSLGGNKCQKTTSYISSGHQLYGDCNYLTSHAISGRECNICSCKGYIADINNIKLKDVHINGFLHQINNFFDYTINNKYPENVFIKTKHHTINNVNKPDKLYAYDEKGNIKELSYPIPGIFGGTRYFINLVKSYMGSLRIMFESKSDISTIMELKIEKEKKLMKDKIISAAAKLVKTKNSLNEERILFEQEKKLFEGEKQKFKQDNETLVSLLKKYDNGDIRDMLNDL